MYNIGAKKNLHFSLYTFNSDIDFLEVLTKGALINYHHPLIIIITLDKLDWYIYGALFL